MKTLLVLHGSGSSLKSDNNLDLGLASAGSTFERASSPYEGSRGCLLILECAARTCSLMIEKGQYLCAADLCYVQRYLFARCTTVVEKFVLNPEVTVRFLPVVLLAEQFALLCVGVLAIG